MEKVPGWFERLLLPRLSLIEGAVKEVRGEVLALRGEMKGGFEAVHSEIRRFDDRVDSLRNELKVEIKGVSEKVDGLDKRIEVTQRLAVVEAKLKEYEQRSK